MGNIVLRIPRTKQKVRILRSEELIKQEIDKRTWLEIEREEARQKELAAQQKAADDYAASLLPATPPIPVPVKSVYTEVYTISDSNQPLKIDLTSVRENAQVLEAIQEEVQNAYDSGFNDGQEAVKAAVRSEIDNYAAWITKFETLSATLNTEHIHDMKKLGEQAVPLAILIAEYILKHEISNNGEILVSQVKHALAELDDENIFKIFINPADMDILNHAKTRLMSDTSRLENTLISANPAVDQGTCVLSTSSGTIDARLKTQLQRIKRTLENELSSDNMISGQ